MKTIIHLDAMTKAIDVTVYPHQGMIAINDLRIVQMSDRALGTLRNALISAIGFPEGQDLDEIDIDAAGLIDAADKITAHVTAGGGAQ